MHPFAFLALRAREVRNDLRFARGRGIRSGVLLVALIATWLLTVAATLGRGFYHAFVQLEASAGGDPGALAAARDVETAVLALALNVQVLFAVLLNAGPAAAFLSSELERVIVAPVPPRRVALAKLVENLPASLAIVAPLTGATAGAYALARGAGPFSVVVILLAVLATALLATGLAGAGAVALARILPRRLVRLALETGAALLGTLGYFAVNVFHFGSRLTGALGRIAGGAQPGGAEAGGGASLLGWLPGGLLARSLAALADHRALLAVATLAGALGAAVLTVLGAARLAQGLYATGWTLAETPPTVRRSRRGPRAATPAAGFSRAEIVKNMRIFTRSPELLLPTLGLLLAFFLPLVVRGGLGVTSHQVAPLLVVGGWCGSLLVALDIGARVVPVDQLAFWRLRAAPVPGRRLAVAKLLSAVTAASPVALVGNVALGAVARLSPLAVAGQALAGLAAVWVGAALGIVIGAHFGDFAWEHRNRMIRMPGQWVMALLVLPLIVFLVLAGFAGRSTAAAVGAHGPAALATACVVAAGLAAALVEACVRLAARRFDRLEWSEA